MVQIISLAVLTLVFSSILFGDFIPAGHDTAYLTSDALQNISFLPHTWESFLGGTDLGHNQLLGMWMQPVWIVIALLARMGLSFALLTKLIIAGQLVVGVYGLTKLLKRLGVNDLAIIVASVWYL